MRIAAGALRGRTVEVPQGTRPTSGRARAALFSRWHETVPGSRFLDLFAGSGGIGLEAVSRGAAQVVLVEQERRAVEILHKTCAELAPGACVVIRASALALPDRVRRPAAFDLVFADPPYAFERHVELLDAIAGLLGPDGEAAIEHSSRVSLPAATAPLHAVASKRYGDSVLSFYRLAG